MKARKFKSYNDEQYNALYNENAQFQSLEKYSDIVFFGLLKVLSINDYSGNLKDLKKIDKIIKSLQNKKSKKKLNPEEIWNGLAAFQFDDYNSISVEDIPDDWGLYPKSLLNRNEIYNRMIDIYERLCVEINKKVFKSFLGYGQLQDRVE